MTVGIYILRFKNTEKVYVGQSISIEDRYISHIYLMKKGEARHKVQEAYNLYGTPILEILLECSKDTLNINEDEAIEIFNSVERGFNTMTKAGKVSQLYGDTCGNSKYSNEEIIKVFKLLVYSPELTQNAISDILEVSVNIVNGISCGDTHKWLETQFSEEYAILLNNKVDRRKSRMGANYQGIYYPTILSPEGLEYNVSSIRGFAREHNLNYSSLGRVLRKSSKSHNGWKLK